MTDIDAQDARAALAGLPEETSHGDSPAPGRVYLPPSHVKAMDPNVALVTGMRGAGKTFWWTALQQPSVRRLVHKSAGPTPSALDENTEVRTGFGVRPLPDDYPSKDVLRDLTEHDAEPRAIWRAVQAWQLAPEGHPVRQCDTWATRTDYVGRNPEEIERLFYNRDKEFEASGVYFLILFDALDRCSDGWKDMYGLIRGLMQTALDMRSYRRLRVKVFLRSDQVDEARIGDFPDASKVLSSVIELSWPARDLYGLLWHSLVNGEKGKAFRGFLGRETKWPSIKTGGISLFSVPRRIISDDAFQRERFHGIAGEFMGRNRRRGFPYTWIPNHLGDTEGRVSPRSFLAALRTAAREADEHYPDHRYALHYESIKRGVQEASRIRVRELQEDYPWVDSVMTPLNGMVVPCHFEQIKNRWEERGVLEGLVDAVKQGEVKLPPRRIERRADGVREDLEALGIFSRMSDDRVNIPDVFRVGYGLGRRGGVKPVR